MYPHARVSEILAMFRDYAGIDKRVLDEKCAIGDETHQNILLDNQDIPPYFDNFPIRDFSKKPELPIKRWDKRGRPYFKSYLQWKEQHKPQYLMQETRFKCDELMITGQFDAIIATDDEPMLIDYKCTSKPDTEIWEMQAHFYYYLLKQNGVDIGMKFQWINLQPTGKYPLVVHMHYNNDIMQKCIDAAVLYWELKNDARCVA